MKKIIKELYPYVIIVVCVVLFRTFIATPVRVDGDSMRESLHNGDILILDEPTSNLDTLNEGEILKSIKENCKDKTIVLISHRKSTTAVCNKTYKLEKGKLILN